ncbi:DeoR/GlpR family DNA-binding transcription regulator [Paenibacillus larvae subsp. larvae]|uniref:DeoR/GlpR family DNA-binding transcription regulator n=1 Tax=Paenibacillus larvae TaxID=1464 RepID=UPI0023A98AFE|nr:DeoR/GlpR family DNA-binding transcription regulator [Paenibacillus larvae]MDE5136782.1 DeoR/GlpR family DNA-binding transcription regulator [Paenibacillus larvae subsp. larvae]
MFSEERREQIVALLNKNKKVYVKELAERFHLSMDSIRRDLTILEERGLLRKTHGGAMLPPRFKTRSYPAGSYAREQMEPIVEYSSGLLRNKEVIFLGGANVHLDMIGSIPHNLPLTVVTNSTKAAEILRTRKKITTYVTGGKLSQCGVMDDLLAQGITRLFTFDRCFFSASDLWGPGKEPPGPEKLQSIRMLAERAHKKILIATHQELPIESWQMSPADLLSDIITDEGLTKEQHHQLNQRGIHIHAVSL